MKGLKKALVDLEKSQKWLAGKLNVSENTVSCWVNDEFYPRKKTLDKISKLLDKEPKELF